MKTTCAPGARAGHFLSCAQGVWHRGAGCARLFERANIAAWLDAAWP
jgi:hypothetical protein